MFHRPRRPYVAPIPHGLCTVAGLADTWRTADSLVDGEPVPCYGDGCSQDDSDPPAAVRAEPWGRVKVSLR